LPVDVIERELLLASLNDLLWKILEKQISA
jgi:hypothetical protein